MCGPASPRLTLTAGGPGDRLLHGAVPVKRIHNRPTDGRRIQDCLREECQRNGLGDRQRRSWRSRDSDVIIIDQLHFHGTGDISENQCKEVSGKLYMEPYLRKRCRKMNLTRVGAPAVTRYPEFNIKSSDGARRTAWAGGRCCGTRIAKERNREENNETITEHRSYDCGPGFGSSRLLTRCRARN